MTTAGLEPATFWCRRRSKPNALPLRQVALLVNDPVLSLTLVIRLISLDIACCLVPLLPTYYSNDGSQLDDAQRRPYSGASSQ